MPHSTRELDIAPMFRSKKGLFIVLSKSYNQDNSTKGYHVVRVNPEEEIYIPKEEFDQAVSDKKISL